MTKPVPITSDERDERAAYWCMRLADARLDAEEQAAFDLWIADDPRNARAFEEAVTIWQGVDTITEAPEMIRYRAEAVDTLRRLNEWRWSRSLLMRCRCPAVAAACIAFVVLMTTLLLQDDTIHYKTGIGERRVVMLKDGSRLTLDAATEVDVELDDTRRTLELVTGRAKFDVAHDPLRPFTVRARDRVTVATGTSFSIELLPSQVRIVLYEGRVEVIDQPDKNVRLAALHAPTTKHIPVRTDASLVLSPGKELIASTAGTPARVVTADLTRARAWESGQLSFEGEPLALAAERMNRYAKNRIVIRDPRIASYEISGVFASGDINAFVEGVTALYPIYVIHEPGALVLAASR